MVAKATAAETNTERAAEVAQRLADDVQAAEQAQAAAMEALDDARTHIAATAQEVTNREALYVAAIAAAADGDEPMTVERMREFRASIVEAKEEADFAALTAQGAEAALSRVAETVAAAHRRVLIDDYIAAIHELNDPNSEIIRLQRQIIEGIFALMPLVSAQRERHNRLAQGWAATPYADKREVTLPPGRRPMADDRQVYQDLPLPVPFNEVRQAILLGITAASTAATEGTDFREALATAARGLTHARFI